MRAGDAGAGDGVDESLRGRSDALEAVVGAGGRDEEDGREVMAMQRFEALRMRLFLDRARVRLPRPLIEL